MSDPFNDPIAEAVGRAAEDTRRERDGVVDDAAAAVDDASDRASELPAAPNDDGIYEEYGNRIGGVQLASTTIPMGSIGIARANPTNWANLRSLADGSLELGSGEIITAATLLSAIDQSRERAAVRSAVTKFGLNPTRAADVLAARAYVWSQTAAPWNFPDVLTSGAELESVSESIMLLEPGTLYLASQGDRLSTTYLRLAAEDGLSDAATLESRIRPANAPAALQTTTTSARAALKLQPNDNMQAHHLVPVNIIAKNLDLATLASEAGWRTDSPDNLIALPGDLQMQARLIERGILLPVQSSSHRDYDGETQRLLSLLETIAGDTPTPLHARAIFEAVAIANRAQILSGLWLPRLH